MLNTLNNPYLAQKAKRSQSSSPITTSSSAVAERPRDAFCHWIFC